MNTYWILGIFTGVIIFSVGSILPLVAYLIYKSRAFINDDNDYNSKAASDKALGILKLPKLADMYLARYSLFDRFLEYFFLGVIGIIAWPLMILAAAVYMFMLFLRLTKRLQKHTSDKDGHK